MHTYLGGRVLVAWADTAVAEPLVRALATEMMGRDPGPLHHSCPFCGSVELGRPYVDAPVEVSVTHAAGLTAVAVSAAGPVGVEVDKDADADWVRREAVGKALGVGLLGDDDTDPVWHGGRRARARGDRRPGHRAGSAGSGRSYGRSPSSALTTVSHLVFIWMR